MTAAVILDPLYPHGSKTWGPSPKPREALSLAELGKQFVPRGRWGAPPGEPSATAPPVTDPAAAANGVSVSWGGLSGQYVMVLPFVPLHTPREGIVAR